jgi:HD-GYP domain-containing protein (c-di-GMP phosphodiesterase class II)
MAAKMVAVTELIPGNILADSVMSFSGKTLLGKEVVLTPRHISLLISWDVQNVFIKTDDEQPEAQPSQETVSKEVSKEVSETSSDEVIDEEYQQFVQEYHSIVTDITQTFDIIKRRNRIPVLHLQDTAGNIHTFITNNGATAINYLLASNYKITDFITHHSITVAFFAGIIARQLKWNEDDIKGVALAGLLHDVGNLAAGKTDSKTDHAHIAETAALLKNTPGITNDVILGIVQHRECIDGSGFPTGASSAKIHPYAKVIAVCDTFHNQSYTNEHANPFPALNVLANEMFGKLDPSVCHTFISRVRDSLLHNKILLSDGQEAEIIYFHPNGSHLPVIRTTDNQIIDLSKHSNKMIHRVMSLSSPSKSLKVAT